MPHPGDGRWMAAGIKWGVAGSRGKIESQHKTYHIKLNFIGLKFLNRDKKLPYQDDLFFGDGVARLTDGRWMEA